MTHRESRVLKELITIDIRKGKSAREIAEKYKIRMDYIYNFCTRNKLTLARSDKNYNPKYSTFQILKELYNGENMTEIAEKFNITRQRVWYIYNCAKEVGLPGLPKR